MDAEAVETVEPRPSDGRITILATAIGDESFTDLNGNGRYDAMDFFEDLPEAFRGDNENGLYDDGMEEFLDFNSDGVYAPENGIYNGVLCSDEAKQSGDGTTELVVSGFKHVRKRGRYFFFSRTG